MKKIHPKTLETIEELRRTMVMGHYAVRSIGNYVREIRMIGEHYPKVPASELTHKQIRDYIVFIREVRGLGRDKCKMVAQSLSFLFKEVLDKPYKLPSKLFPRKVFKIPVIMSTAEVRQLFTTPLSLKQKAICELFYSTGVRLSECCHIRLRDIDSVNGYIHLHNGKGSKDRMLLLSPRCLNTLKQYYADYAPKEYLFEGHVKGKACSSSSLRFSIKMSMIRAGLHHKKYTSHTFRHSFATHLLNNGVDLLTIQNLMGHSDLKTTMVYLHLQTKKMLSVRSPLDALYDRNDLRWDETDVDFVT